MPTTSILAADAQRAHERAVEVVREHGPAERAERLESITVGFATTRHPQHLVTFQAEILAAFAEIIEGQHRRISELEKTAAPEEAPEEAPEAAPEEAPTAAAKSSEEGRKGSQKKRAK